MAPGRKHRSRLQATSPRPAHDKAGNAKRPCAPKTMRLWIPRSVLPPQCDMLPWCVSQKSCCSPRQALLARVLEFPSPSLFWSIASCGTRGASQSKACGCIASTPCELPAAGAVAVGWTPERPRYAIPQNEPTRAKGKNKRRSGTRRRPKCALEHTTVCKRGGCRHKMPTAAALERRAVRQRLAVRLLHPWVRQGCVRRVAAGSHAAALTALPCLGPSAPPGSFRPRGRASRAGARRRFLSR